MPLAAQYTRSFCQLAKARPIFWPYQLQLVFFIARMDSEIDLVDVDMPNIPISINFHLSEKWGRAKSINCIKRVEHLKTIAMFDGTKCCVM